MNISGFCDLNICIPASKFKSEDINTVVKLGYRTIALNTTVGEISNEAPKKKKKGHSKDNIPAPQTVTDSEEISQKLQILQRLTIYITDTNDLPKYCKSECARKYDIIAVIPKSTSALQVACACKEIDLISFDASERPLRMNRKMYNLAVANGLFFEVPYAPAISDSGQRKNTIQTAHNYHSYGKSKNIIFTSGANEIIKLRGPYDVANLAILFGLSEEQAKFSMLNTSRSLISRAEGRRYGKTAMTMMITELGIKSDEEESEDEPVAKKSKPASDSDSDNQMMDL